MQPLRKQMFQRCRKCSHWEFVHNIGNNKNQCQTVADKQGKCSECKCSEWIPTDNLEYLEYLYNLKEGNNVSNR